MTDLEKFTKLYKSFGIRCKVFTKDATKRIVFHEGSLCREDWYTFSEKFDGYCDFYTEIIFDMNGRFVKQGFWE